MKQQWIVHFIGWILYGVLISACSSKKARLPGAEKFTVLHDDQTGLHFSNKLTVTQDFNVFKYAYFYNGAGIGTGDFNNDGLIDIFFASNLGDNKIYLNSGNLHFRDVSGEAGIPAEKGWSTGVSVVDINNDGLLDIYICRVGKHETLSSHNILLVCQGIDKNGVPHYRDESREYGLDFSGFSTQAVFFDYDMDGDLDMYLLNHTIRQNGVYGFREKLLSSFNPLSGDRLYRNDGNKFTDVTTEAGIYHSVIGYGLGICVSDVQLNGYPDIYVGNDFDENDYLYINQRNGTFKEELNDHLMHTSRFSMGVDIADANNDGYPDIMTVDMMPYDPYMLKRSEGEDAYDIFQYKLGYGYNHQYTRNNLQYNRRNGMFSEIGVYANVYATDWSWCPLWVDFDNDGLKDLFITNGISKRLNDIDYINYISNIEIQSKMKNDRIDERDIALSNKFPQIKIPNKFYENTGDMAFRDIGDEIGESTPTFSNGAAYADFDNDGDLDLVVNNIDDPALLYQNRSNDNRSRPYVNVRLKGPVANVNALGSKLILFANGGVRVYEKYPVHGYLSSMEIPIHIGLYNTHIDSAFLVWPDNSYQRIALKGDSALVTFQYQPNLPTFNYSTITSYKKNPTRPTQDITANVELKYKHEENSFTEFERDKLMPHMLSTEGPALAVGDANEDGLEDVFIGSSRSRQKSIFMQQRGGKFRQSPQPQLVDDSLFEDVDATWVDVNRDGHMDLVVASGGNEYPANDPHLAPRVYLNDGHAHFSRSTEAFDNISVNASCAVAADFNGDGYADLFIGGRSVPGNYGSVPRSYLLQNDGKGKFRDVTSTNAPEMAGIGFVTQAIWFDLDKDGDQDLIVTLEWGGIVAFMNEKGHFKKRILTDKKGWWNFVLPVDINNDGHIDLIAGNLGLNNMLHASAEHPVRLYYSDFNENGKKEPILTYYLGGLEIPFADRQELGEQIPALKKKFLYAEDFAKASLTDLFGAEALSKAAVFTADYFSNAVLINDGTLNFSLKPLPWEAQLSPYRDAVAVDANHDSLPDILLVGNYYENNVQMGRYDADFGSLLINLGQGNFSVQSLKGTVIRGQSRHVRKIDIAGQEAFIIARNNDSTRVISFGTRAAH